MINKTMNYNLKGLLLLDNRLMISQKDKRIVRIQKYYLIIDDKFYSSRDLNLMKWENKYNYSFSRDIMDRSAWYGNLEIVKWIFYVVKEDYVDDDEMDIAAENGHLEVVKFLHFNRSEGCTKDAMDAAARFGHLEVVKWLH